MLERILKFSLTHRGLVVLLTIAMAIVGAHALTTLPIDAVPDITNKQVQINTEAAALSTVEMEKQVTFPIETALMGIPGLEYTRSLSRNGFCQITAVFHDDIDIYFARQQVSERLLAVREELPGGAEPAMGAIATGLGEVYMWTVSFEHPGGAGVPAAGGAPGWQGDGTYLTPEGEVLRTEVEREAYLRTIQEWVIRPQLRMVPGLADVDSIGGFEKQYHVEPDPDRLVAYGLSFGDIADALEANNASTGAGYVEQSGERLVVRATGRVEPPNQAAQLSAIVVGTHDGTPIHVRDVAEVVVGRELRTGSASANGVEAVVGTAVMRTGENSRVVAQGVHERLPQIAHNLPPDVVITPVLNRMKLVDATIGTVERNLIEGAVLVIVVLFIALGNIRAALITACAIPLSMLFAAFGMNRMGISGNLMSLGAVDFGIIVDGAVIIVENCMRRLAERQQALDRVLTLRERVAATFGASLQVLSPAAMGVTIIITVYLPILTLAGIEGKMFHPMAWTVILALTSAMLLALTFVPAMVALAITGRVTEKENVLVRWVKRAYVPTVAAALRYRWAVVGAGALLFLAAVGLFFALGAVFVPRLDERDFAIHAMRIPSISISQSTRMQLDVEQALAAMPEVQVVFSKTGTAEMATDPMPPNVSDTFVILRPRETWPDPHLPKPVLRRRFAAALDRLPGNKYEYTQPIEMRFNELIAGVRSDVAVMVYGDQFAAMERTAAQIATELRAVPGAADVKVEQTKGLATLTIAPRRDVLARFGLNVTDVQDVVAAAVGGREAGQVFEGDRRFDVFVRLPERYRADLSALRRLRIPVPEDPDAAAGHPDGIAIAARDGGGAPSVPLELLADLRVEEGPNQISRQNGKRRVIVQTNVRGRDIASFVAEAKRRIDERVALPPGGWLDWGGQFENLQAAQARLSLVIPACLLLILFLLYSTFRSIKYAVMVFTGVPLALTGGILALWIRGIPFSISAAVGFIALSGVAVLNGLVMVTFINQLRQEGLATRDAIARGATVRLRPVLMTALVAALGFLPMALATGTGAEVQRPLATVVIGGIATSTLLTLVVLPALYLIVARDGDLRPPPESLDLAMSAGVRTETSVADQ